MENDKNENDGWVKLSSDEIIDLQKRRELKLRDTNCPTGIGVGLKWAKAKLAKKKFIDEVTIVEKKGNI